MLMFILFLTGLLAGTVDAIAGGGGLISVPVLLSVGLPPHVVFGTNKLQGAVGTLVAARRYWQAGWVSLRDLYLGIVFGLLGAVAGAVTNQLVSSDLLKQIAPIMLGLIFIYTLLSPRLGQVDQPPRMSQWLFYAIFGFALAFYDGFFGPGAGSFWVFMLVFFLGFNLIKATAYTKLLNLNSSLIAVVCFAAGSNIDYRVGLTMALGQIIGGQLGANLAITKGAPLIRPLFLWMVFITIATLAYRSYGHDLSAWLTVKFHVVPYLPLLVAVVLVSIILIIKRLQSVNTLDYDGRA